MIQGTSIPRLLIAAATRVTDISGPVISTRSFIWVHVVKSSQEISNQEFHNCENATAYILATLSQLWSRPLKCLSKFSAADDFYQELQTVLICIRCQFQLCNPMKTATTRPASSAARRRTITIASVKRRNLAPEVTHQGFRVQLWWSLRKWRLLVYGKAKKRSDALVLSSLMRVVHSSSVSSIPCTKSVKFHLHFLERSTVDSVCVCGRAQTCMELNEDSVYRGRKQRRM